MQQYFTSLKFLCLFIITTLSCTLILLSGCTKHNKNSEAQSDKQLRVIMVGPPAVGKGTAAIAISKKYSLPTISVGELLRDQITRGTEVGKKVEADVKAGRLADTNIIKQLIAVRISQPDCKKGFILDGSPREINEAKYIDWLFQKTPGHNIMINITGSEKALVKRMNTRVFCASMCNTGKVKQTHSGCKYCNGSEVVRDDDNVAVLRSRIRVYERNNKPIIAYFKNHSQYRYVEVDGMKGRDLVMAQISSVIDRELTKEILATHNKKDVVPNDNVAVLSSNSSAAAAR